MSDDMKVWQRIGMPDTGENFDGTVRAEIWGAFVKVMVEADFNRNEVADGDCVYSGDGFIAPFAESASDLLALHQGGENAS